MVFGDGEVRCGLLMEGLITGKDARGGAQNDTKYPRLAYLVQAPDSTSLPLYPRRPPPTHQC
jgi:hypothetical protein